MKEMLSTEFMYFVRVFAAGICGIIIGYERKNRAKEAGIRTHFIVASAAALMMIVSKYGFFDLIQRGIYEGIEVKLDPSRVASCIITGIGFLGAGMIFVQKQTIKGLTTAAGIWATAGIGMAVGSGLYVIGFLVTVLILVAQVLLHGNSRFLAIPHYKQLHVFDVDAAGYQKELKAGLEKLKVKIDDIEITANREKHTYNYTVVVEIPTTVTEEELLNIIQFNCSIESLK